MSEPLVWLPFSPDHLDPAPAGLRYEVVRPEPGEPLPASAAEVEVYVTSYCPYCVRAKMLLKKKGVAFKEIDVSDDPAKRAWLRQATGQHTVPQIFIGGKSVGGSDDLHALDRAGQLDPLLAG